MKRGKLERKTEEISEKKLPEKNDRRKTQKKKE